MTVDWLSVAHNFINTLAHSHCLRVDWAYTRLVKAVLHTLGVPDQFVHARMRSRPEQKASSSRWHIVQICHHPQPAALIGAPVKMYTLVLFKRAGTALAVQLRADEWLAQFRAVSLRQRCINASRVIAATFTRRDAGICGDVIIEAHDAVPQQLPRDSLDSGIVAE
jgi:hypothetical protein